MIENIDGKYGDEYIDRSESADAKRFRWLLNGNGYFMEEEVLCGRRKDDYEEQDRCRSAIDEAMKDEELGC